MNNLIKLLQNQELVWQGSAKITSQKKISTGYDELDQQLDGGFLQTGVTEIQALNGIGELRLLLTTLSASLSEQRLVVFIAPQGIVTPQALAAQNIELDKVVEIFPENQKDSLWAAEQCLRSGACHSVVLWIYEALEIHQIKRLQIASETGHCRQFVLRAYKAESLSLPFDLSLTLHPHTKGLNVKINKRKRGWSSKHFTIDMEKYWPTLTLQPTPDNLVYFPNIKAG